VCSCVFFKFVVVIQYSSLSLLLSVVCVYLLYSATSFVGEKNKVYILNWYVYSKTERIL